MRDYFYKYVDIDTTEKILANRSFRYNSPLEFNDPFDIQTKLVPEYNLDQFPLKAMELIERYVKNDISIPGPGNEFTEAILLLRDGAKNQGYKKEEIEKTTFPIFGYMLDEYKHLISQLNAHWQRSMAKSRVFCVTEEHDNLLMWAHYAKDHTGSVIKIATLPEKDTPLSVAKKVKYKAKPIQFYSLDVIIEWLLFGAEPDLRKFEYTTHAHRKSKIWKYEKEWRVVDMCDYENKTDLYVDHTFYPQQLLSILFGCNACNKTITRLTAIAKDINPDVNIYKAKKMHLEYGLEFEKI